MGERVSAIADLFHQQKFSRLMKQIKSDNAQGKYNLTDVFDFFSQNNFSMESLGVSSFDEIRGVNTKVQLEEMERM